MINNQVSTTIINISLLQKKNKDFKENFEL